jgi:exodeoxyribonuclease V gamma subunit
MSHPRGNLLLMLHLHFSNRYERLRHKLLERLDRTPVDPFVAQQIIVPNTALRRDLTLAAAERYGIVANLQFGYLAQWLWRQIGRVTHVAEDSPFAAPVLTWRVYQTLEESNWMRAHPRLQAWLQESDDVMRLEFAQKVAGLLESYVTYRPFWLERWQQGLPAGPAHASPDALADQAWQADLWRRLNAQLALPTQDPVKAFIAALSHMSPEEAQSLGLPTEAHVFALPAIAPLHLDLLRALGQVCTLHLYVLNPCEAFWFDLLAPRTLTWLKQRGGASSSAGHEAGHALLNAWGTQTQAHVGLLIDRFGEHMTDDADFEAPEGHSLLAQLQTSILTLAPLEPGSITLAPTDRSLEVRVCHSLTRELEVLHDGLLGLFAGDDPGLPALKPWEVLVVTPDLESAAPLIEGVFGSIPDARRIDWTITGRARSRVHAPASALLAVLALIGSRVTASAVFSVLQHDTVARRFGLDEAGLQQIHTWMRSSGFRWAFDADHLTRLNLPAHAAHTLESALSRLFLGYALPDASPAPFQGQLPSGGAQGQAAQALGRLWRFTQSLRALRDRTSRPHSPDAWRTVLDDALNTFIAPQDDQLDDWRELRNTLHQLVTQMHTGGLTQAVSLPVVRSALQTLLDDPARGGVPSGAVTFTSMSALRALPYRVVCVIGLNDGSFPGTQAPAEFDLIALQPQPGDRQRRIDDRNLFLDLLLSARHMLYLSYTGHSIRDNTPLPPSVLISELLETVTQATAAEQARTQLVVHHTLQPFASEAFAPPASGADPRLQSFNTELAGALKARLAGPQQITSTQPNAIEAANAPRPGNDPDSADSPDILDAPDSPDEDGPDPDEPSQAPAFFVSPLPPPDPAWRSVPIERLIAFFRHPARALLTHRLGLSLANSQDALEDDEPFIVTGAARRSLAARLLPAMLQGQTAQQLHTAARAGLELPAGALGEQALSTELTALEAFAERVRAARHAPLLPAQSVQWSCTLGGESWQITAHLTDLRDCGVLAWRYAPLRATDRLSAWITLLVAGAQPPAGMAPQALFIAQDGLLQLQMPQDPTAHLQRLLALYRQGLSEPLPVFPQTAWAFMDSGERLSEARKIWAPHQDRGWSESQDPAWRLALRGRSDPLDHRFIALAREVFGPLMEHTLEQP